MRNEKKAMDHIYASLMERSYRPMDQLIGYILSGDPTYITNHHGARHLIADVDRYDLLCDLLKDYFAAETGGTI